MQVGDGSEEEEGDWVVDDEDSSGGAEAWLIALEIVGSAQMISDSKRVHSYLEQFKQFIIKQFLYFKLVKCNYFGSYTKKGIDFKILLIWLFDLVWSYFVA